MLGEFDEVDTASPTGTVVPLLDELVAFEEDTGCVVLVVEFVELVLVVFAGCAVELLLVVFNDIVFVVFVESIVVTFVCKNLLLDINLLPSGKGPVEVAFRALTFLPDVWQLSDKAIVVIALTVVCGIIALSLFKHPANRTRELVMRFACG